MVPEQELVQFSAAAPEGSGIFMDEHWTLQNRECQYFSECVCKHHCALSAPRHLLGVNLEIKSCAWCREQRLLCFGFSDCSQ